MYSCLGNTKRRIPVASANTLLKGILAVKNAVVEHSSFSTNARGEKTLIVRLRPYKKDANRCPICHQKCPIYDRASYRRTWRANDCNGILVYLKSYTHRISCPDHGVLVADVPWAFRDSGFTRDFDMTVTWMAENLSRSAIAEFMRIDWKTVGRCISRARAELEPDPSKRLDGLVNIGIDETSYRKGHKYITVVVNHDTNTVVWASDKHGKAVFTKFLKVLTPGQRSSIRVVTGDGARWIDPCIKEYLPNAIRCVDSFHVAEWANEALDAQRKEAWRNAQNTVKELKDTTMRKRGRGALVDEGSIAVREAEEKAKQIKSSAFALGKAPEHLTNKQEILLAQIALTDKRLYRCYEMKEQLRLILHMNDVEDAKEALQRFFWRATHSRIPEFCELGHKIRRHEQNILNTIREKMSNARIEATNNKIKLIIRRAYGFRNVDSMINMVMLICSDIIVPLPNRPKKEPKTQ